MSDQLHDTIPNYLNTSFVNEHNTSLPYLATSCHINKLIENLTKLDDMDQVNILGQI